MINPEKISKSLGNTRLKMGVSFKELLVISLFPMILSFFEIDPILCLLSFGVSLLILIARYQFFEANYFLNKFNHRPEYKWERIKIND